MFQTCVASSERGDELVHVAMTFEATKLASGLECGGGYPSERHPAVSAALHAAAHTADPSVEVLDGVRRLERATERARESERA